LIITASHNPKEDNGYKVYWNNGAQIIDPHDTEIIRLAEAEPMPLPNEYWDTADLMKSPLLKSADSVTDAYFEVEKASLSYHKSINEGYTAEIHLYGIPRRWLSLREAYVQGEQQEADPNFPTVPFPNPEEGAKVLTLSFRTAEAYGSTFIVANDPDADRIQIAEKKANGDWKVFTGNEMGALMTWWVWMNWSEKNPRVKKSDVYILNSAVSSQIVKTMAEKEGFKSDVTLTGFKWMGNKAHELRQKGKHVILAWEESIGFMPGHPADKDGVSTGAMFAEMAAWLQTQEKTLQDQLFELYSEYGFHLVRSSYWFTPSPAVTKELFASLRKDLKVSREDRSG
ncbi:hypothetical protein COOONC_13948, partial [Cooperia oncophora]